MRVGINAFSHDSGLIDLIGINSFARMVATLAFLMEFNIQQWLLAKRILERKQEVSVNSRSISAVGFLNALRLSAAKVRSQVLRIGSRHTL